MAEASDRKTKNPTDAMRLGSDRNNRAKCEGNGRNRLIKIREVDSARVTGKELTKIINCFVHGSL